MLSRLLTVSLIVVICVPELAAQQPSSLKAADVIKGDHPELKARVEKHMAFVGEAYKLTDAQRTNIKGTLTKLVPLEYAYRIRTDLTLSRIRTAMALLPSQATVSAEGEKEIAAKFQLEAQGIRANAPLSMKNLIKFTEKVLQKEQIDTGRAFLAKKYAKNGKTLDIETIDTAILGAITPLSLPNMAQPEPIAPTDLENLPEGMRKAPEAPTAPASPTPKPRASTPPKPRPAPKAPEPVKPAPPTDGWRTSLEQIADGYDFDKRQRLIAGAILDSSMRKVGVHMETHQSEYEAANDVPDADMKASELRRLNEPLDQIYYKLCRRVDSLASLEQKTKSKEGKGEN